MNKVPSNNRGIRNAFKRCDHTLQRIPANYFAVPLFAIQGLLIYGDLQTGPWVPFGVFYLLALYICIKYIGVNTAYLMAFVVVSGKTWVRVQHFPDEILWWQIGWQYISSLSIYSIFCYLINNELVARRAAQDTATKASQRAGEAERKLLRVSEETQQRIGRELHDDLGQHLTGIAFFAEALAQKLKEIQFKELCDAERIPLMLNQSISKIRDMAHGLCPAELEEHGFHNILEKFARNIEAMHGVECFCSGPVYGPIEENREISTHLFRIIQEAVNNAIKHGQATQITLSTTLLPSVFILEVVDNGNGLKQDHNKNTSRGLGLRSMRYRAELIGATLGVSPRIGTNGTHVTINMPINL